MVAMFTPLWWVEVTAAKNGSLFQVHHPQHGWLAFVFPPEHAALLGTALVKHCGMYGHFAGLMPPLTGIVN